MRTHASEEERKAVRHVNNSSSVFGAYKRKSESLLTPALHDPFLIPDPHGTKGKFWDYLSTAWGLSQ